LTFHRKIVLILVFLSVFSIPFSLVFNVRGARVTTTEILFSIAFLVWTVGIFRSYKNRIELTPMAIPIAFFLTTCVLSTLNAQNKFIAFRETLQFIWLFGIYFLIFHFAKDRKDISDILLLSVLAGVIISMVGLYQYFYVHEPFHFRINDFRLKAYATFGQPNAFGSYLIGIVPLSIGLFNYYDSWRLKLLLLSSSFVMSLALFATFSRGSWIGLVFGMGIMFAVTYKRLSTISLLLTSLTVLLAAGIILGDIYFIKPEVIKPEVIKPEVIKPEVIKRFSNTQRLLLAKSALDMTIDHPFIGVGIGNYSVQLPNYASKELIESAQIDYNPKERKWFVNPNKKIDIEIAHNMFLQIAAEMGLLGLAAFLWVLYAYYKSSLKLSRTTADIREYGLRAGLVGSFTAIIVSGVFGWPFSHGTQEILVLVMAMSMAGWSKG
jgi:putative inorganic carbon (HCO3(-)) transporter